MRYDLLDRLVVAFALLYGLDWRMTLREVTYAGPAVMETLHMLCHTVRKVDDASLGHSLLADDHCLFLDAVRLAYDGLDPSVCKWLYHADFPMYQILRLLDRLFTPYLMPSKAAFHFFYWPMCRFLTHYFLARFLHLVMDFLWLDCEWLHRKWWPKRSCSLDLLKTFRMNDLCGPLYASFRVLCSFTCQCSCITLFSSYFV